MSFQTLYQPYMPNNEYDDLDNQARRINNQQREQNNNVLNKMHSTYYDYDNYNNYAIMPQCQQENDYFNQDQYQIPYYQDDQYALINTPKIQPTRYSNERKNNFYTSQDVVGDIMNSPGNDVISTYSSLSPRQKSQVKSIVDSHTRTTNNNQDISHNMTIEHIKTCESCKQHLVSIFQTINVDHVNNSRPHPISESKPDSQLASISWRITNSDINYIIILIIIGIIILLLLDLLIN